MNAKHLVWLLLGAGAFFVPSAQAQTRPHPQEKTRTAVVAPPPAPAVNSAGASLFAAGGKDVSGRDVTKHPLELRLAFTSQPNPGNLMSGSVEAAYWLSKYWSLDLGYSLVLANYGSIRAQSNGIDPFPAAINYDANGNPITNPFGAPGEEQKRSRLDSERWFLHYLSVGPTLRIDSPFTWSSGIFIIGSVHLGHGWARDSAHADMAFNIPLLLSLTEGLGIPLGSKQQSTVSVLASYVVAPAHRSSTGGAGASDTRLPLHWWGLRLQAGYAF